MSGTSSLSSTRSRDPGPSKRGSFLHTPFCPSSKEEAVLILQAPGMVNPPLSGRLCQAGCKQSTPGPKSSKPGRLGSEDCCREGGTGAGRDLRDARKRDGGGLAHSSANPRFTRSRPSSLPATGPPGPFSLSSWPWDDSSHREEAECCVSLWVRVCLNM